MEKSSHFPYGLCAQSMAGARLPLRIFAAEPLRKPMRSTSDEPIERPPETDVALLDALRVDQTSALGALYDRYASLVYGLALAILTNSQDAEDLTQEVFLALCRSDYDPARGSFSGFLITMTRSRAIDKLRSRGRNVRFLKSWGQVAPPEASPFTPLDEMSLTEGSRLVRNALTQLPDNQRQALELAYYKDLSQMEIAAQLNAPLGTVKSWTRKGLFSLKRALQDLVG
jgi:RNA polymerase sigma-70 factor, ECF subfamily